MSLLGGVTFSNCRPMGNTFAAVCTSSFEEAHRLLREKNLQFFGGSLEAPVERPGPGAGNQASRFVTMELLP